MTDQPDPAPETGAERVSTGTAISGTSVIGAREASDQTSANRARS